MITPKSSGTSKGSKKRKSKNKKQDLHSDDISFSKEEPVGESFHFEEKPAHSIPNEKYDQPSQIKQETIPEESREDESTEKKSDYRRPYKEDIEQLLASAKTITESPLKASAKKQRIDDLVDEWTDNFGNISTEIDVKLNEMLDLVYSDELQEKAQRLIRSEAPLGELYSNIEHFEKELEESEYSLPNDLYVTLGNKKREVNSELERRNVEDDKKVLFFIQNQILPQYHIEDKINHEHN